jgi:hypothetical protein
MASSRKSGSLKRAAGDAGVSRARAGAATAKSPRAKSAAAMGKAAGRPPEHDNPVAVAAFLKSLKHPLAPALEAVRSAILKASPGITEGIKWNCPSFYLNGWFATLNIRNDRVFLVLHQGVKARKDSTIRTRIPDPEGLLTWHSPDRASLGFASEADFRNRRRAFDAILAAWAAEQAKS